MTNDLLTDRLHEATDDLAARLRSGSAVRALATRRRQRRRVLTGAVAAVAVAAVATSVQVENDADRLVPTVNRSSSPAPSASPTSEPIPPPSGAPSPSATGSSPPSPAGSPTGVGASGNPLAGFHFPEEATWRPVPHEVTVERSDAVGTPWALDPCLPTAYPTDQQRIAMVSLNRLGPEAGDVRQLAVYPDVATAADVMAGFRRVLAACARPSYPGGPNTYVTAPVHIGDEGLVVVDSSYQDGRQAPGGGYSVVMRDGRSVYLAGIGREFLPKGPTDADATQLIDVARQQLPLPQ